MQPYLAIPLLSAMGLASFGGTCLLMAPELRANRTCGTLLLAAAWWAGCEVLWNTSSEVSTALFLQRLAAPGFVFLAPLATRLVHEVAEIPPRSLARLLPAAFTLGTLSLVVAWFSPWIIAGMVRTT